MVLIVGLGNPEKKYFGTRHNVGRYMVEWLSVFAKASWSKNHKLVSDLAYFKLENRDILLARPETYMNDSGKAVKKLYEYYQHKPLVGSLKKNHIFIVHDDLDIALGEWKIQFGKGPKDHNGVESVEKELGTKDFWRIRIGVEYRGTERKIPGDQYVLMPFGEEESSRIDSVMPHVVKEALAHALRI